jgi:hypothetical protein
MMKYLVLGLTALAIAAGTACSSSATACDKTVCGVKPDAAAITACEDAKTKNSYTKCTSEVDALASCSDTNTTCAGTVPTVKAGACDSQLAAYVKCAAANP